MLEEEGASRPFVIMDRGLDELIPGVAQALAPLSGAMRFEKAPASPPSGWSSDRPRAGRVRG